MIGAEARGGGLGREGPGGGELGGGLGEARGDHGDDEVAAAVAVRSEDAVEPDLAQRAEDGGDVTVRQRAANGEHLRGGRGRNDGSALEQGALVHKSLKLLKYLRIYETCILAKVLM